MSLDSASDVVMDPSGIDSKPMDMPPPEVVDADDYGLGPNVTDPNASPEGGDLPSTQAASAPRDYYLATAARQYGINEADFPDDASLRKAVDWASAYHARQQQVYQQQMQQSQQQPQQRQLPQQLPMPQAWQNPLSGLDDIDPRFVKAYDQIAQHFNHTLAYALQQMNGTYGQLHQQFSQFQTQAQQRAAKEVWSRADSAISALGEHYEQFVGKGSVKGHARDPVYDGIRQQLIQKAAYDMQLKGVDPTEADSDDWKAFMKRAADSEFSDHMKSVARQEVAQQMKARQSMIQPRQATTVRRDKSKDDAVAFVEEFAANRN